MSEIFDGGDYDLGGARVRLDAALDRLLTGAFGNRVGAVHDDDFEARQQDLESAYRGFTGMCARLANDGRVER